MAGTVPPVGATAASLTGGVQVINVQQQSPSVGGQKAMAPRIIISQQNASGRTAIQGVSAIFSGS